jgi:hypothetical protein
MGNTSIKLSDEARQRVAIENGVDIDDIPYDAEAFFDVRFEGQFLPATQTDPEALADAVVTITSVVMTTTVPMVDFKWESVHHDATEQVIEHVYDDLSKYCEHYS